MAAPITFRQRLHEILEAGHTDDRVSLAFDTFLIVLILANVIAFALQTVEPFATRHHQSLELFNLISVSVFTVEYLARLWACVELPPLRNLPAWKARLLFMCRPLLIVDLLAILPFYLSYFISIDLRVLRVLRLLRFFKIARYSPALQTIGRVISSERRALLGALMIMLSLVLFASTGIYFIERDVQPEKFGSVPAAAWWAIATLTTVGYGDTIPATGAGKVFGALVMLFGLGMFALPIGIVATAFVHEINRREFVVTWSMVAKVPLFAKLNAVAFTKIMSALQSHSFPAGSVILHRGEQANAIYFIASGEVQVDREGESHSLGSGDFFGDHSLDETHSTEYMDAAALSNCDLLVLERHDFLRLLKENRELRDQINAVVEERKLAQAKASESKQKHNQS